MTRSDRNNSACGQDCRRASGRGAECIDTGSGGPGGSHRPSQTEVSPPDECPCDRLKAVWLLCLCPEWEAETNVEHLLALNNSAELFFLGEGTCPSAGLAVTSLTVWKTGLGSQEVALSHGPGSVLVTSCCLSAQLPGLASLSGCVPKWWGMQLNEKVIMSFPRE